MPLLTESVELTKERRGLNPSRAGGDPNACVGWSVESGVGEKWARMEVKEQSVKLERLGVCWRQSG